MVLPACAWSRMAPLWQEMLQLQAPKNPALDSSCHHPIPLAFPLPALLPQLNVFWHFPGVGVSSIPAHFHHPLAIKP